MVASSVPTLMPERTLAPAGSANVGDGTDRDLASPAAWLGPLSDGLKPNLTILPQTFSAEPHYEDQASLGLVIQAAANPATPAALAAIGTALFGLFRRPLNNSGASFSSESNIDGEQMGWSRSLPVTALRGALTLQTIMGSLGGLSPAVATALKTELLRLQKISPNPTTFFSALPTSPAVLAQAFALATLKAARMPATPAAQTAMIAQMSELADNPNTFANNLIQFSNRFATTSTRQTKFASGLFGSEARRFTRELGLVDSRIAQQFGTILTQRARQDGVQPYQYLANVVSSGTSALNNRSSALFTALATATAQAYGLSVQKVAAFMRQQASPEQMVASLNALAASPQVRASLRAEEPASGSVMEARSGGERRNQGAGGARKKLRIRRPTSPAGGGGGKPPDGKKDKLPVGGDGGGGGQGDKFRSLGDGNSTYRPGENTPPPPAKLPDITQISWGLRGLGSHFPKVGSALKNPWVAIPLSLAALAAMIKPQLTRYTEGAVIADATSTPSMPSTRAFKPTIVNGKLAKEKFITYRELYLRGLKGQGKPDDQITSLLSQFDLITKNLTGNNRKYPDKIWNTIYEGANLLNQERQRDQSAGGMTLDDLLKKYPAYFGLQQNQLKDAVTAYYLNENFLQGIATSSRSQKVTEYALKLQNDETLQSVVTAGIVGQPSTSVSHPALWGEAVAQNAVSQEIKTLRDADMQKIDSYISAKNLQDLQRTTTPIDIAARPAQRGVDPQADDDYIKSLDTAIAKINNRIGGMGRDGSPQYAKAVETLNQLRVLRESFIKSTQTLRQAEIGNDTARRNNRLAVQQKIAAEIAKRNTTLSESSSLLSVPISISGTELRIPARNPSETDTEYGIRIGDHCEAAAKLLIENSQGASVNFGDRSYSDIPSLAKALQSSMWKKIRELEQGSREDGLPTQRNYQPPTQGIDPAPVPTSPNPAADPQYIVPPNTTP